MRFQRSHAVLLLSVAVWNVVTFGNFARNLYSAWQAGAERDTGYWVAHSVLIVVNVAIAVALGSLGWRAWRATDPSLINDGSASGEVSRRS